MNLKGQKERREEIVGKLEDILKVAEGETRDLTQEEDTEYNSLETELDTVEANITKLEKQEARKKQIAEAEFKKEEEARKLAGGASSSESDSETKEILGLSNKFNMAKAIRTITGMESESGVEKELSEEARREARLGGADISYQGIGIPGAVLRAEWEASEKRTDIDQATSGIQPTVVGKYVEAIRQNAVFSQVIPSSNILTGLSGDFKIPSVGSQSLAWATAENSAAADGGSNFGKDTLAPIRLTGYADISDKVIMQNGEQAMNFVMADFGRESANKIDAALFSTTNVTNAIASIAATSGVGTFTEAATYAAPSSTVNGTVYDDFLAALQVLANANSANGALAFVGHTKLLSDLVKSPQVLSVSPGVSGVEYDAPLKLKVNGVSFYLTTSNTSNGTTSADFIGGNFNHQFLGMFGGLDISVDPYSVKLNAQKRIIVHRWCDSALMRGGAFVKSVTLLS